MTLDQAYAKYQGQSLLVPGASEDNRGQCVQWADYVLHDVYGQPYVWANAIDWWNKFDSFPQLKNNFVKVTDGSIKKGDFVIFNQQVGSVYGHIDVALADGTTSNFLGADSNWGGNKTVHQVRHYGYVIGAIRKKTQEEDMGLTKGNIDGIKWLTLRQHATQAEFNKYEGKPVATFLEYITEVQSTHGVAPQQVKQPVASGYKPYSGEQLFVKE